MAQLDTFCKSQHTVQWCLVVSLHVRIGISVWLELRIFTHLQQNSCAGDQRFKSSAHTSPIHESTIGTLSTEKQKQNV